MIVRVLKVSTVSGKDEDGREVGDHWLLADFGCAWGDDDKEYCIYLTTDRVSASPRYADMADSLEPEALAKWMANRINEEWERRKAGGGNTIRIIDLSRTTCPTCGPEGLLDCGGQGEEHNNIWCEECGWEGKVKELMR